MKKKRPEKPNQNTNNLNNEEFFFHLCICGGVCFFFSWDIEICKFSVEENFGVGHGNKFYCFPWNKLINFVMEQNEELCCGIKLKVCYRTKIISLPWNKRWKFEMALCSVAENFSLYIFQILFKVTSFNKLYGSSNISKIVFAK